MIFRKYTCIHVLILMKIESMNFKKESEEREGRAWKKERKRRNVLIKL